MRAALIPDVVLAAVFITLGGMASLQAQELIPCFSCSTSACPTKELPPCPGQQDKQAAERRAAERRAAERRAAEQRAAEQRAKLEGGRDAFSLTVIKRSGGALRLTENGASRFVCSTTSSTSCAPRAFRAGRCITRWNGCMIFPTRKTRRPCSKNCWAINLIDRSKQGGSARCLKVTMCPAWPGGSPR